MPKAIINFKEMKEKVPTIPGEKATSSVIYLPLSWAGKKVAVLLIGENVKVNNKGGN